MFSYFKKRNAMKQAAERSERVINDYKNLAVYVDTYLHRGKIITFNPKHLVNNSLKFADGKFTNSKVAGEVTFSDSYYIDIKCLINGKIVSLELDAMKHYKHQMELLKSEIDILDTI